MPYHLTWDHPLAACVVGIAILLCTFATIAPADPATQPAAAAKSPSPDPKMKPDEVVRAVIESLSTNDAADNGIRTTWKFASPANKEMTGPIERFIPMVKTPAYAPMLQRNQVHYGQLETQDDKAVQIVVLIAPDGTRNAYVFQLSRQVDGDLKGCWMTDGVIRINLPDEPPDGQPV